MPYVAHNSLVKGGIVLDELDRHFHTNQNTFALKAIALACMVLDHIGVVFFPYAIWLRIVGRIAFPLYAWCLVVGVERTRSVSRYALRLFTLFMISQPLYMMALNHPPYWFSFFSYKIPWVKPNIFLTLLLGLFAINGLRTHRPWQTLFLVFASYYLNADYGLRGLLCILLLYVLKDNPFALALGYSVFCIAWGETAQLDLALPFLHLRLSWGSASSAIFQSGQLTLRLQHFALLALPFMLIPMHPIPPRSQRQAMLQRLFYWAYPAHLAAIWFLKRLFW